MKREGLSSGECMQAYPVIAGDGNFVTVPFFEVASLFERAGEKLFPSSVTEHGRIENGGKE